MSDNDLDSSEAYLDACFSDEIGRDVLLAFHRLSSQLQSDNEGVDVTSIIDESLNAFHHHQQDIIYEKMKRSTVLRNAMNDSESNEDHNADHIESSPTSSSSDHSQPIRSPAQSSEKSQPIKPVPISSDKSKSIPTSNNNAYELPADTNSYDDDDVLVEELDELVYHHDNDINDEKTRSSPTESSTAANQLLPEFEDEWIDDDDTGYFFVKITEDEFEHLEEVAIRNKQVAKKLSADINSWEQADKDLRKGPLSTPTSKLLASPDHYQGYQQDLIDATRSMPSSHKKSLSTAEDDEDEDVIANSLRVDDGASSRREFASIASDDDMAISNEIPAPVPASSIASTNGDDIAESLAIGKILSEGSFGHVPSSGSIASSDHASPKQKLGYEVHSRPRRGYYIQSSSKSDVYDDKHLESSSSATPNKADILGQSHVRGVDGSIHAYFNLKVIFEPNTTGFEDKDFSPPKGSIIAGRYQVKEVLGQAAFSTALQCIDLESSLYSEEDQWVCLKVIKNKKDFFDQSIDEIKLLQLINSRGDPDKMNVIRLIDYFYFKEHLFIVSELLKENLYEFGKYVRDSQLEPYFTLPRLKKITRQVLEALEYIHSLNLIHCDLKPENIVIKSYSRCEVKLIDFGSSCFTTDYLSTYIQSRSYRAPEVVLGHPYDGRIDIWSLGAVAAEMYTGYVLFQNDSLASMIARIIGIIGNFPSEVLEQGRETSKYFTADNSLVYEKAENGDIVLIYPKKTTLAQRLHLVDELPSPLSSASSPRQQQRSPSIKQLSDEALFIDFVAETLLLHPQQRPTAKQALKHQWLQGAYDLDFTQIDSVYAAPQAVPDDDEEGEDDEDIDHESHGDDEIDHESHGDDDIDGESHGDVDEEDEDAEDVEDGHSGEDDEDDGEYEDIDDDDDEEDEQDGIVEAIEEDVHVDHAKVYFDTTTVVEGCIFDTSHNSLGTSSVYRGVSDISASLDEDESSSIASPRSTGNRPGHDRDESFRHIAYTAPPEYDDSIVIDDERTIDEIAAADVEDDDNDVDEDDGDVDMEGQLDVD